LYVKCLCCATNCNVNITHVLIHQKVTTNCFNEQLNDDNNNDNDDDDDDIMTVKYCTVTLVILNAVRICLSTVAKTKIKLF